MSSEIPQKLGHLRIPLEDVLKATNNFADKNIIGKGGFGNVYKGVLTRNGGESIRIAARRLDRKGGQGVVEFWTEVSVLSELVSAAWIVKMIGFCDENGEKIIISQHYPKGSLVRYLCNPSFTWDRRWSLVETIPLAVQDIHEHKDFFVIHRNINSSTILLNKKWFPGLSGFEFSIKQPIDRKTNVVLSLPVGTQGYIDPAMDKDGGVTYKSDIYSLGVVLFEIICGRKANEDGKLLVPLVKYHYQKGTLKDIIHPDLLSLMDPKSFRRFSYIAETVYPCLNDDPALRPEAGDLFFKLSYSEKIADYEETQHQVTHRTNDVLGEEDKDEKGEGKKEEDVDREASMSSFDSFCKVKKLGHLRIELSDILLATNNFSKTFEIKNNDYYILYKAELRCFDKDYISLVKGNNNKDELPKRDYTVMIKCFHSTKDSIYREIETLSHCNHPNIESLIGICENGSKLILVYEYVPKKDLDDYLVSHILTWEKRLKICIDVANGLSYLHDEIEDWKVIHNYISCYTIKLDDHWRAKISSFGNSLLLPLNEDVVALPTDGSYWGNSFKEYKDQEYLVNHNTQTELDVYSFGVVMLEILCGEDAAHLDSQGPLREALAEKARKWINTGTIKKRIASALMEEHNENNFILHKGPNKDSLDTFLKIAHSCLVEKRNQRPKMKVVVEELGKALAFHENSKDTFKMSLEDVKIATQDFSNEIGEGGSGRVFKGQIADKQGKGHFPIVAKKLDTSQAHWERQFLNELEILYVYQHENIIGLVGYSKETDEKIIVYEHASKGSLDRYLNYDGLTWRNRLKICVDIATGLEFLHGGEEGQVVIHRDIKSANILLFDDWKAKLGDFGLSLISAIDKKTDYVIHHPCGTQNYVDPLYLKSGMLTIESDIYSLGVVLFEILYGRAVYSITKDKSLSLLKFIKQKFEEGKQEEMVFKGIKQEIVPKSLTTFINIIYKCLEDDREKRPTSKEVLAELKMALKFQANERRQNIQNVPDERVQSFNIETLQKICAHNVTYFTELIRICCCHISKDTVLQFFCGSYFIRGRLDEVSKRRCLQLSKKVVFTACDVIRPFLFLCHPACFFLSRLLRWCQLFVIVGLLVFCVVNMYAYF